VATLSPIKHGHCICGEQSLLQQLITHKIVVKGELQSSDYNSPLAVQNIPHFDLLLLQGMDQRTSLNYVRA
jgi:hypothetical protein